MRILYTLGALSIVAACAMPSDSYAPILDGPVTRDFQSDLTACRELAKQSPTGPGEVGGAIVAGALFAGFVVDHEEPDMLPWGVALGALAGWIGAVADQNAERKTIVATCFQGRGHPVVG